MVVRANIHYARDMFFLQMPGRSPCRSCTDSNACQESITTVLSPPATCLEVPASSGRIPYHTPVKNFEKYTQFVKDHTDKLGGDSCQLMPCTLTQNMYALCVAMVSAIKKDMPSLHSDLGCETIDRPHGLRRAGSQSHYDSSVPGEWGISAQ